MMLNKKKGPPAPLPKAEAGNVNDLARSNSTAPTQSLSDSDEKTSARVIKRRRHFFLPKPTVEIPSFRILPDTDDDIDEKGKSTKADKIETGRKRKRDSVESKIVAEKEISSVDDAPVVASDDEMEQSENISLYSDEISAEDFAPEEEEGINALQERPKKMHKKDDGNRDGETHGQADREVRGHRRPGSQATSKYTEMSNHWEQYARFQQTMVPNMVRLARIVTNAMEKLDADGESGEGDPDGDDVFDIRMSKQANPVFEKFLSTRFSQIMEAASQTYRHRGMERMTPDDVRLAIRLNPIFAQFDIERFLNGNRDLAPAFITFTNQLMVGKTHSKTHRCVYQHTDKRAKVAQKKHK